MTSIWFYDIIEFTSLMYDLSMSKGSCLHFMWEWATLSKIMYKMP